MTERYTYLYQLPRDLYAPGCPVLIAAGALVRGNHTDRYLAQLKLQRISGKPIRSVTVEILPLDAQGRVSVGPVLCAYPCRAARDEFFGGQRGIPLSDRTERVRDEERLPASLTARVTEVIFRNGDHWQSEEEPEPLPPQTDLESALRNPELIRQYRLRFSSKSSWLPQRAKDLWRCSCGAFNREDEETCHLCGQSRDAQLALGMGDLRRDMTERLTLESERKEELEILADRTWAETTAGAERLWKRAGLALAILAAAGGLYLLAAKVAAPAIRYSRAEELLASYDYGGAAEKFTELAEYRDSAERAAAAEEMGRISEQAAGLLAAGNYDKAYSLLESIGETETVIQSKLARAEAALAAGDEETAKTILAGVDDPRAAALLPTPEPTPELTPGETGAEPTTDPTTKPTAEPTPPAPDPKEDIALKDARPGDIVTFGRYRQDADGAEKTPIEWIVLDRQGSSILLVSRYVLDFLPFGDPGETSWTDCRLRSWFTVEFSLDAFSFDEWSLIKTTALDPDKNSKSRAKPWGGTTDKVFILSASEIEDLFLGPEEARCEPTAYAAARANSRWLADGNAAWWLRTVGNQNGSAAYADANGFAVRFGADMSGELGVRPAMWVNVG